jgi:hypothetical protein
VPALDLALGLGMAGSAAGVSMPLYFVQPFGEIGGDVARAVVGQQPRPVPTLAWSQPEACSARFSVSVTSSAFMLVHSFQAMM